MSNKRDWEALQERWVQGDALSQDEETARKTVKDPGSQRELAFFDALRAEAPKLSEFETAQVVKRVLLAASGSRLRLVDAKAPQLSAPPRRSLFPRIALGLGLVLAGAALGTAGFTLSARSRQTPKLAASKVAPSSATRATGSVARTELVFASGDVRADGHPVSAGKQLLARGQRVSTGLGQACLTIDPAIDVCLAAATEVELESLDDAALRLRVLRGTAVAELAPRHANQTFSLLAGDAIATARGTAFAIDFAPADHVSRITVIEGKVEVTARGQSTLIPTHASLDFGESLGAHSLVGRSEEARLWSLLEPRKLWAAAALGVLAVEAGQSPARASVDDLGPFELPLSVFVEPRRHHVVLHGGAQESPFDPEVASGAVYTLRAPDPRTSAGHGASEDDSAALLLARARERLRQKDPRGALGLYERLRARHPASPEATTVLVTLGKLELEVGTPARALAAFDSYLRHDGPLAPEALMGRIRALRALGRQTAERDAIHAYLARYPHGFDAPALSKRLATLSDP